MHADVRGKQANEAMVVELKHRVEAREAAAARQQMSWQKLQSIRMDRFQVFSRAGTRRGWVDTAAILMKLLENHRRFSRRSEQDEYRKGR
jgi:hypothetical protein